eukprot:gene20886-21617_t
MSHIGDATALAIVHLNKRITTTLPLFLAQQHIKSGTSTQERPGPLCEIRHNDDKLNLAVAAASRRMSDLEEQLGTKLFKREPHGVAITESGTKLLQYIRQIDNLIDRLEGDAQAFNHGLDGRIIIGAPKAVIIQFLAHEISTIQHKYPRISLKIVEENSKIVQQLLRDKVIDVGIYEKKSGFLDLEKSPYQEDRLVLVYKRPYFQFSDKPV